MKPNLSKNLIIGISFIIALILLYFGVNFLKGMNVLKKQNSYVALFKDISGLNVSSPVYVNGFQIGSVSGIKMHSSNPVQLAVNIELEHQYKIPKGSHFEFGADILGASTVSLITNENSSEIYHPGDTIPGKQKTGMLDGVASIMPKADSILLHIDSAVVSLNKLLSNPMWGESISGIGSTINQLEISSKSLNTLVTSLKDDVPTIAKNLSAVSTDLKDISGKINSLEIDKTFASIDQTLSTLKVITEKMNNPNNSLGKLTNSTILHDSLTNTINTATKLLEDIRSNPEKYLSVKVRLF